VDVDVNDFTADNLRWEQTFTWNTTCQEVPDYLFQLIRVYGSETPDWKQALSIQTYSSAPTITLSMAEGSGSYRWRVRPLGTLAGGVFPTL